MNETETTPAPVAGQPAPDISLPDDRGGVRRLADRRGEWTIVYFYPEDDTAGCTTEACQFRDLAPSFDAQGAEVWGISPMAPRATPASATSSGCRSPCCPTRTMPSRGATAPGR